jgi:hypothetical protein
MDDPAVSDAGEPRWQYAVLWRYGALLLAAVGLLAMGFGAADVSGASISVTLMTLGFICLISGVVLPRIEGKFTAGPSGLSAQMLAVHKLDMYRYIASGPVTGVIRHLADSDAAAGSDMETEPTKYPGDAYVTVGDVWDALDAAGFRVAEAAAGTAFLQGPGGRRISLPNRGFVDWRPASAELLALLKSWGVKSPTASGGYHAPADLPPDKATGTISGVPDNPLESSDRPD